MLLKASRGVSYNNIDKGGNFKTIIELISEDKGLLS